MNFVLDILTSCPRMLVPQQNVLQSCLYCGASGTVSTSLYSEVDSLDDGSIQCESYAGLDSVSLNITILTLICIAKSRSARCHFLN